MKTLIRGLTDVDSAAKYAIGTRKEDDDGNVYIYLQGLDTIVAGTLVTYYITSIAASVTTILVSGGVGLVAIAMAAIVTGTFGWFQIAGENRAVITSRAEAAKADIVVTVGDDTMADVDALIADPTGELFIAKGSAIEIEDVFVTGGGYDLTDNALQTAKTAGGGGALAAGDVFRCNKITSVATIEYIIPAASPGTAVYTAANTGVIAPPVSDTEVANGLINHAIFSVEESSGVGGITFNYPSISGVLPAA